MKPEENAQRSFAWLIFGIALTGTITVLSVPYAIGQHGLAGLWIPAILLLPLALQMAAAVTLKRLASHAHDNNPTH